jgi:hypothetical protein
LVPDRRCGTQGYQHDDEQTCGERPFLEHLELVYPGTILRGRSESRAAVNAAPALDEMRERWRSAARFP